MALILKARFGHDLEELRANLDSVEVGLGRLVGEVTRKKLQPLVAEVQELIPLDPTHRGWKGHDASWHAKEDPGHIRDSVKGGADTSRLTIYTTHAGGPVHWWGGTIRPRLTLIDIHHEAGAGEDFVSKTADEVVADVDDGLERLLRRNNL